MGTRVELALSNGADALICGYMSGREAVFMAAQHSRWRVDRHEVSHGWHGFQKRPS